MKFFVSSVCVTLLHVRMGRPECLCNIGLRCSICHKRSLLVREYIFPLTITKMENTKRCYSISKWSTIAEDLEINALGGLAAAFFVVASSAPY